MYDKSTRVIIWLRWFVATYAFLDFFEEGQGIDVLEGRRGGKLQLELGVLQLSIEPVHLHPRFDRQDRVDHLTRATNQSNG